MQLQKLYVVSIVISIEVILVSIEPILEGIVVILTSIEPILEKCVHMQVQYLRVL